MINFHEGYYLSIFSNLYQKNSDKNNMYLDEDLCKFVIISCRLLLRMGSVSEKVVEKIKIHLIVGEIFFLKTLPFRK
jgi:hypothetical protein